jgi:hypothetical protein
MPTIQALDSENCSIPPDHRPALRTKVGDELEASNAKIKELQAKIDEIGGMPFSGMGFQGRGPKTVDDGLYFLPRAQEHQQNLGEELNRCSTDSRRLFPSHLLQLKPVQAATGFHLHIVVRRQRRMSPMQNLHTARACRGWRLARVRRPT